MSPCANEVYIKKDSHYVEKKACVILLSCIHHTPYYYSVKVRKRFTNMIKTFIKRMTKSRILEIDVRFAYNDQYQ